MRKISKGKIQKNREKYAAGERQTLQLLELHEAFHDWVEKMRQTHEIDFFPQGMDGFADWQEVVSETWSEKQWRAWKNDVASFRRNFRLTANYTEALCYYIVTGSFKDARTAKVEVTADHSDAREWIKLKIHASATKEEIMDAVLSAKAFLNAEVKQNPDGSFSVRSDTKRWRSWKYRPELDRHIKAFSLMRRKGHDPLLVNDLDVVAQLDADEDDGAVEIKNDRASDRKLARQMRVIRARIEKAFSERFPGNTL